MRNAHRLLNDIVDGYVHVHHVDDDVGDEIDGDRVKETPMDTFELNVTLAASSIAVFRTAGSKSQIQVDEHNMCKAQWMLNDIVAGRW